MESNPILQELHPGTQTKVLSLGSLEPGLETECEHRLSIPELKCCRTKTVHGLGLPNWTQTKITWEESTSAEELPSSDWPLGASVALGLD